MGKYTAALLLGVLLATPSTWAAEPCSTLSGREVITQAVLNMQDLKTEGVTEREMLELVAEDEELPPGLKAALYEGIGYLYSPAEHSISLIVQAMQFACEDASR
ncbi:hypothetical protein [Halomonas sp. H5]|uniref:hypothetical protein n=1 Tax=Halomonas sp. H5 TaxID=3423910 RepID=UPI003D36F39D